VGTGHRGMPAPVPPAGKTVAACSPVKGRLHGDPALVHGDLAVALDQAGRQRVVLPATAPWSVGATPAKRTARDDSTWLELSPSSPSRATSSTVAWSESLEDVRAGFSGSDGGEAARRLSEDEGKFCDFATSRAFWTAQRQII
jgi:hypothetical protein